MVKFSVYLNRRVFVMKPVLLALDLHPRFKCSIKIQTYCSALIPTRRCCTDESGTLHADWTNVLYTTAELRARAVATLNRFKPPSNVFTDRSKAVLLLWFTISVIVCLHVCSGVIFILDSHLDKIWERSFLLVVF